MNKINYRGQQRIPVANSTLQCFKGLERRFSLRLAKRMIYKQITRENNNDNKRIVYKRIARENDNDLQQCHCHIIFVKFLYKWCFS